MSVIPQTRVLLANGRSSDSSYALLGLPEGFKAPSVRFRLDFSDPVGSF